MKFERFNMSVVENSIEVGLVKLIETRGWTIYEDQPKDDDWSIAAIRNDGAVSCITQENRLAALQLLGAESLRPEHEYSSLLINFKRLHKDAILPTYAKVGDAGMDVTAVDMKETPDFIEYDLGFSIEIPKGYVGLLFPRSSISKMDLTLCNSVGLIDSGYRGPMIARFAVHWSGSQLRKVYTVGDRVAQLMFLPYPQIIFEEVDKLSDSERGEGGFGSTGA